MDNIFYQPRINFTMKILGNGENFPSWLGGGALGWTTYSKAMMRDGANVVASIANATIVDVTTIDATIVSTIADALTWVVVRWSVAGRMDAYIVEGFSEKCGGFGGQNTPIYYIIG